MIHEYAASPALFASESHATFLYQAFALDSGRLLCEYPRKKWAHLAIALIKRETADGEQQKKLIAAVLALLKRSVFRQGQQWNDEQNWITNAVTEHGRLPFKSILWEGPGQPHANVRTPSIALCDEAEWKCAHSSHVQRSAAEMIKPLVDMLQLSRQVILIDRNFDPQDDRWVNVLLAALATLSQSPRQPKVTHVELVVSNMNRVTDAQFEGLFRASVEPRVPPGFTVNVNMKDRSKLHARYILTDTIGIQFADGLDERPGGELTMLTRLSATSHALEWDLARRDVYRQFRFGPRR